MASCAEQVQSCLLDVIAGRSAPRSGIARGLRRLAAKALWAAKGGREASPDEVDDLVQEFLVKMLVLRTRRGADALAKEWGSMPAPKLYGYVRTMLKNLAVEANPAWDTQRALRDVVKAALSKGLPVASGLPSTLEKDGRFARLLVAAACAELVDRGASCEAGVLTSALMAEYELGTTNGVEVDSVDIVASTPTALDELSVRAGGASLTNALEAALGKASLAVLQARRKGMAEVARRLGVAVSTAYARCAQAEKVLAEVIRAHEGTADEVAFAMGSLGILSAP